MHIYIGGRSENNIKCVPHNDLGWKNRTTRYNCRLSATSLALRVISQFRSCGTYLVLSRSPSVVIVVSRLSSGILGVYLGALTLPVGWREGHLACKKIVSVVNAGVWLRGVAVGCRTCDQ